MLPQKFTRVLMRLMVIAHLGSTADLSLSPSLGTWKNRYWGLRLNFWRQFICFMNSRKSLNTSRFCPGGWWIALSTTKTLSFRIFRLSEIFNAHLLPPESTAWPRRPQHPFINLLWSYHLFGKTNAQQIPTVIPTSMPISIALLANKSPGTKVEAPGKPNDSFWADKNNKSTSEKQLFVKAWPETNIQKPLG